jgi:hypothetical protein
MRRILLSLLLVLITFPSLASAQGIAEGEASTWNILPNAEKWICYQRDQLQALGMPNPKDIGMPVRKKQVLKDKSIINDDCLDLGECRDLRRAKQVYGLIMPGKYLATKVRCGSMSMEDIPYYFTGILGFLINIAGTLAVIMVMIGGYQYAIGGLTEDKSKGTDTIKHALIGLIVVLVAWTLVQILQAALTYAPVTPPPKKEEPVKTDASV